MNINYIAKVTFNYFVEISITISTLRECIEKLQILDTTEEHQRRLSEIPEIHVDPHMDPTYESPEETDDKKEGISSCIIGELFISFLAY